MANLASGEVVKVGAQGLEFGFKVIGAPVGIPVSAMVEH